MQEQLRRSGKTAATAVSDYLTELFKHAKQTLARRYGDYFVRTTRLEVVLTVPAIWSDAAKEATLSAAKNAGMGDDIRMISEPEAAAVYTLQAIQPNHLKKGDNFIVCDAGGGTVDLISYEIKEVSPLRVEESVRGTGACCGAAFLNVKFEEYVRSKMGASEFQKVCDRKPKAWLAALKSWEEYV
jgi:actin-like ATPase involved in cell morphogenesis